MSGLILNGLPVAVDLWKSRHCSGVKLFFLTHIHSDHIAGLSDRWPYKIYCSRLTRKLLLLKFKGLEGKVEALEMNAPALISLDNGTGDLITVTPIDARHCLGSCMFLFEGTFGRILYTGDFRFCPAMLYDEHFVTNVIGKSIDELYIDNTYCNSKNLKLKNREECFAEILELIKEYDDHVIILPLKTFGKESLLICLANTLKRKICVSEKRFQMLEVLEAPNVFTTNDEETNIIAVDTANLSALQRDKYSRDRPVLEILATGLNQALNGKMFECRNNRVVVEYSDHCSFEELMEFVKIIAPRKIYPIVSACGSGRLATENPDFTNMQCFERFLNTDRPDARVYNLDLRDINISPIKTASSTLSNKYESPSRIFKLTDVCTKRNSPAKSSPGKMSTKLRSPVPRTSTQAHSTPGRKSSQSNPSRKNKNSPVTVKGSKSASELPSGRTDGNVTGETSRDKLRKRSGTAMKCLWAKPSKREKGVIYNNSENDID